MKIPYYVVDAFAEHVFEGAPTGVAIMSEWPRVETMISMAAENALPETAYLKKAGDDYEIRWCAPNAEIDLCGHATLASGYVVMEILEPGRESVNFLSGCGTLTVTKRNGLYEMQLPKRVPEPAELSEEMVAALGGLVPKETYKSRDWFFLLESEEEVKNLKPDFDAMRALDYGDGVIVTASGTRSDFVTRAFFPKLLTDEDYVCGSAHCNLIPFWYERTGKTEMISRQYSSRGATLYCTMGDDHIKVAGAVSFYSRGEVELPDEMI